MTRPAPSRLGVGGAVLWPVLWPVVAFTFVANLLTATSPIFMMQTIDRVLGSGNLHTLVLLALIACIALAVMHLLEAIRSVLLRRSVALWDQSEGPRLMRAATRDGATIAKIRQDLETVKTFLGGTSVPALLDAPWIGLFLVLAYIIHPAFALLGGGACLLLVCLSVWGHVASRGHRETVAARKQADHLTRALENSADIGRSMDLADNILAARHLLSGPVTDRIRRLAEGQIYRRSFAGFVRATTQIATLSVGATLVLEGSLSGGAMIASSIILMKALGPVERVISVSVELGDFLAANQALGSLTPAELPNDGPPEMATGAHRITVQTVLLRDAADRPPRLQGLNLTVPAGSCLGVTGAAGSGKSSLAALLAGVVTPTIGAVLVGDGLSMNRGASEHGITTGYLPQNPQLFPGTVAQNIARFGEDIAMEQLIAAAKLVGVHQNIGRLSGGYKTMIGQPTSSLSGCDHQLIAIARAIFALPRIVVLDDPTAGLDTRARQGVLRVLQTLRASGSTLIFTSHEPWLLAQADTLAVLEAGHMADYGAAPMVLARLNAAEHTIEIAPRKSDIPKLVQWIEAQMSSWSDSGAISRCTLVAMHLFEVCGHQLGGGQRLTMTFQREGDGVTLSAGGRGQPIPPVRLQRAQALFAANGSPRFETVPDPTDLALGLLCNLSDTFSQQICPDGQCRISVGLDFQSASADPALKVG